MFDAATMSLILDYIYHDCSSRLRYRVTSKTNNQALISYLLSVGGKTVNVREDSLVATMLRNRLVSDAARLALKSISNVPWTAEDPIQSAPYNIVDMMARLVSGFQDM